MRACVCEFVCRGNRLNCVCVRVCLYGDREIERQYGCLQLRDSVCECNGERECACVCLNDTERERKSVCVCLNVTDRD